MPRAGAWLQWLLALSPCSLAVPTDPSQKILTASVPKRKLNGKFLHITDFHPDDFYKPHASTAEDIACHWGKGFAGAYGAELTDCDSPFSLVNATFDWVGAHLKDEIDFIIWTGDSARHDSDEKLPRNTAEVLRTNQELADKFYDIFAGQNGRLEIPVIPTFGNNDFLPHNIFSPGPNKWLHSYSNIWKHFVPEEQRHSFEFGGWFYVEAVPNHLAVFSLNTMYFFDRNAAVDGCASPSEPGFAHFEWLRVQLQRMRDNGMKAILIGHVPPARTDNKALWDETCWQKYTLWLDKYRDVVVGSLYGHMNIDHFLLGDTWEVNIDNAEAESARELQPRKTRSVVDDADDISIQSKSDYLQDLREEWALLPGSAFSALKDDDVDANDVSLTGKKKKKKGKKGKGFKKIGGKFAERYQLAFVSPSIVPNYFPSLRVMEYNITGLEDKPTWADVQQQPALSGPEGEGPRLELKRDTGADLNSKKGKKGKKGKDKKPKDPNLIVPEDPQDNAVPGPAYFPQPLTLTGYTQYYANLTHINDDIAESSYDGQGWHDGDHHHHKPKHDTPQPREFKFEVEYTTFNDKRYKLPDLTVRSLFQLAYRMGKDGNGKSTALDTLMREGDVSEGEEDTQDDADMSTDSDDDLDFDEEEEASAQKKKKKGKKGKHHQKPKKDKKNKVWMTFYQRAFVSAVSVDDLD